MKQIRILYYMHISCKRLISDSNYYTLRNILKYLNRYYPDKYFLYITYPESEENNHTMKQLKEEFKNIDEIPIKYHTTNAFFRNALDFESLNKKFKDYDLILSQSPETVFELLSFSIFKGLYCPCISYSNWLPSLISQSTYANYMKSQMEKNCLYVKYFYNYFLCHQNYCNSKHGVKLINEGFKNIPGGEFTQNRVKPLYLATDHEEIDKYKPENLKRFDVPTLVFNHRHNVYTGFTEFFKAVETVIRLRPELKFKIFMTSVGENDKTYKFNIPDKYFLNKETLPYDKYVETLWKCHIQVSPHDGTNQWSMSHFDGMFANLVPLYRRGHFFDEMVEELNLSNEYSFNNENELVEKLIYMIENIKHFTDNNGKIYNHFRKNWTWDKLIHSWAIAIDDAYEQTRVHKTDKFDKIKEIKFPISWKDVRNLINLGGERAVNAYKKSFKIKYDVKEDMENPDIMFYQEDQEIRKTRGFF